MRFPILLLPLLLAACGSVGPTPGPPEPAPAPAPAPTADNSRTSLDWPGLYTGLVPTTDGQALQTALSLSEDETYTLRTKDPAAGSQESVHSGRFAWEPDGGSIKLLDIDSTDRPIYYKVGENYLRQLDLINRPIEGSLSELYYLRKDHSGLFGVTWNLSHLNGVPITTDKRVPHLTFAVNGQTVSGMAACNSFRGSYILQGDSLKFPTPITTKMACPELDLESRFLSALRATVTYRVAEDTLYLFDSRQAEAARLYADAPAD